ncbi:hypothetical protein [Salarchaeum japonicum]|uniref:hypothetical protein n=1 Tax=Salarchaeum japonicum TaxID=555573 RepID=UPI003C70B24B
MTTDTDTPSDDAPGPESLDTDDSDVEPDAENADEQPALDDDEMADLAGIGEEIEDDLDDAEPDDGDETSDEIESAGESSESTPSGDRRKWGDMYCNIAVTATESLIEGLDGDAEVSGDDLRDLDVDDAFNEMMAERGRPEDVPPQQWVFMGTAMFVVGNVVAQTDVLERLLDDV